MNEVALKMKKRKTKPNKENTMNPKTLELIDLMEDLSKLEAEYTGVEV